MKKYIALLLALLLCFALCACGEGMDTRPSQPTPGATEGPAPTAPAKPVDSKPNQCNHSFGEWTVSVEPTCRQKGKETRMCSCGETETRAISATGHQYEAVVTAPTCTRHGFTTYTCSCGSSYIADQVDVLEHDYQETARVEATSNQDGSVTCTCAVCGYVHTETLPATGSVGLEYVHNGDGTCTVAGMGTCTDVDVYILDYYEGSKVTAIGDKAFAEQAGITSIHIPDTVETIGTRAFCACSAITEINIPSSVSNIGSQIFYKCDALHTVYYNGTYGSKDNPFLNTANIKKVVFGGEKVPKYICYNLQNIEEVVILDGVTSIGNCSFDGCTNLNSISIPKSVNYIGLHPFCDCTSLSKVYLVDIEAWCRIDIDGSWNSAGTSPFGYGAALYLNGELVMDLNIPEGVTLIREYVFYGCSSLKSITIPGCVAKMEYGAFYNCNNLTSVVFLDGVTRIGSSAFKNCRSLTSVAIPDSVTSIGDYAFSGCSSLTSIIIPDGVTSIGSNSFAGCSSLTSIEIPDSVTSIGSSAFSSCSSLTSIVIPDSVTSIGDYAFQGCTGLTSITIPDSVTSIAPYAFVNCSSLTSIEIPDNVISIGSAAFYDCSSLTSIEIPDSVTSIGWGAFSGCSSLTSVTIPNSVTSIGSHAFYDCSNLTSVTIPDSVTSIDIYTFSDCRSLKEIRFGGTKEQWNAVSKRSSWNYNTGNYTIYCTDGEISK